MLSSSIDWALRGGGERLLPPGWVDYSASPMPGSERYGYGAGFSTNRGDGEGQRYRIAQGLPADAIMARGAFGNTSLSCPRSVWS
jgi:hypothetical protein